MTDHKSAVKVKAKKMTPAAEQTTMIQKMADSLNRVHKRNIK